MEISVDIKENVKNFKETNNNNKDLICKEFLCADVNVVIFYINETVNDEELEKHVIRPVINYKLEEKPTVKILLEKVLSVANCEEQDSFADLALAVLEGNAVMFIDGEDKGIKLNVAKLAQRAVIEPPTSAVVYGPREGFIENIKTNINLIRKRLPNSALKIENMQIGLYTKTKVAVVYINDIADNKIVKKIVSRLKNIKIDGIIDSHYLVSFLEERKNSIFKQVGKTEKPDVIVAKMLEGRIAIIVDGSPVALTLPFIVFEDLQNSDDYYQRSFHVSVIRTFRIFGLLLSILLPGLYVAVQLYHYRVIPIKFLITIMNSTQGLPFSPLLEIVFVIVLFEILFESSLRMPKYLGMALSIVGALVLGDTAVKAGLISPPAVMIIALTGISFYTVPEQTNQLSILRLLFTILGGCVGLLGIVVGSVCLLSYLVEFNSYDSPYLAPYAPYITQDLKDGIFKKQTVAINTRPKSIPNQKRLKKIKNKGETL